MPTSMRVAIVDPYYQAFLDATYAQEPQLADAPYAEQRERILARFFGTADFYSRALRDLGHEAEDLISNCEPLQRRWAREAGMRSRWWRREVSLADILDAQIEALDADVVYVHTMGAMSRPRLDRWRRAGRLVVGQIASPAPPDELSRGFDLVITSFPHFVEHFEALGVETIYQPLAFEPRVLERIGTVDRRWDTVFVGGIDPRVHRGGTRLLEQIADAVDLQVWGYGADRLPAASPLRRRWHGEAWGLDMYRALAAGRIVVNRHIDVAAGYANNMRLYEATGVGTLVLTESAPNLHELFTPGEEVVTYDDPADIPQIVTDLLADRPRMEAIARAGQARTLARHTWPLRMAELADVLGARSRR
jgi:hypothetical protein